ncbi:hypothetical protein H8E77_27325, partial [bacterium]|nr:hypothetical protein [bacterium]
EPPVRDWSEWPQVSVGPEVGAIERIGDRYYLMRCYREYGLGGRQVGWDPWQKLAWTLSTLE